MQAFQPFVEFRELLVQSLGSRHGPGGLPQLRYRAAALVPAGKAPYGPLNSGHELLAVAQQVPPLEKSLLLPDLQLGPFQLVDLELEAVHPPLLLGLIHLQGFQPLSGPLHGLVASGVVPQLPVHLTEAVQVGPMLFLVQQLLSIMLAVDVQQGSADFPQLGHSYGPAAHPAGVFAVGVDLPLQQQLPVLRLDAALLQCRQGRHAGKYGADKGFRRPGADQIPAGPLTQHSAHGVDDNAFTGAGFAGKGVEALIEGNIGFLYYCDVFNVQQL